MIFSGSSPKRVLIVEDSPDMQQAYKDMFWDETDKYQVEFETNAEEALKIVDKKPFDLVILDIIMEPMTGDWFFAYLRRGKKMTSLPVLIVSVLSPDMLHRTENAENVAFLQKPVKKAELFAKIKEMVGL